MASRKRKATGKAVARRYNQEPMEVRSLLFTSGDADYFSADQEKKQLRAVARWLLAHIHDLNWGQREVYTDYDKPDYPQKLVPLPANNKDLVERFIRREKFLYPKRLTQKLIIRHLLAEPVKHHVNGEVVIKPLTLYFTGKCKRHRQSCVTLLPIDIDCHKSGSLPGAVALAEALRKRFFPGLYFETSTNGQGVHPFLLMDKTGVDDAEYNRVLLRELQPWLRKWLAYFKHDVEMVEVKGTAPVAHYDETGQRLVEFTFGLLAKLPRDWRRFDELQQTTCLSVAQLRQIIANNPVPEAVSLSNISQISLFSSGSTILARANSGEGHEDRLQDGWKGRSWQIISDYFLGRANPPRKLNTILTITARLALFQDYTLTNITAALKQFCREIPETAWGCSSALGNWTEVDRRIERIVGQVENNHHQPKPEESNLILTQVAKVWMGKGKLILDKETWEQTPRYDLGDVELPEAYAQEITYYFAEALPKKHRAKAPHIAVRMGKLSAQKYREGNGISYEYWEQFLKDQFDFAPRKCGDTAKLLKHAKALGVIQVAKPAVQGQWATTYDVGLRMAQYIGMGTINHNAQPLTADDYRKLEEVFLVSEQFDSISKNCYAASR